VDDYLRRMATKQTLHKEPTEGDGKTRRGFSGPFVCPLSKPSSHPPLVRGNVSYFRLVKEESNEPLGIVTANGQP